MLRQSNRIARALTSRSVAPTNRTRLFMCALEERAVPTVFTVLNTNDAGADSLRAAILAANADANPDPDVINFSGVTGTISLTTGEIPVSGDLTINGPGAANLSVSGGALSRIFNISGTGRRTVNIAGLTLTGGKSTGNGGAAIIADENVTFLNCDLVGNSANEGGAVSLTGLRSVDNNIFLTFDGCNLKSNTATLDSGAVNMQEAGSLTVRNCTVSGNSAGSDGGMTYFNRRGGLLIENSTISGNTATGQGGAVYFFDRVSNLGFTVRNSTIANNSAGGNGGGFALATANGLFQFINSTIAYNTSGLGGGGVNQAGGTTTALAFESTIVANNIALSGNDVATGATVPVFLKNSAIGDNSSIALPVDLGGNIPAFTPLNLDILKSNGGPRETILPLNLSPLINNGSNPASLVDDTRGPGFARVVGARIDIGAAEAADPDPTAAAAAPDVSVAGGTVYTITMTYADSGNIDVSTIGAGDITVSGPGGFTVTPTFVGPPVPNTDATKITATYTFVPPGTNWDNGDNGLYTINVETNQVKDKAGNAIVAGPNTTFTVGISKTFTVTTEIDGGPGSLRQAILDANAFDSFGDVIAFDPSMNGKTILLAGQLDISQPLAINGPGSTKLTIDGGGATRLFGVSAVALPFTVTFSGLKMTNAFVAGNGGAIQAGQHNIVISKCEVSGNKANSGAAVDVAGLRQQQSNLFLTIEDSVISNNTVTGGGAAFRMSQSANLIIRNSTVSGNSAAGNGGVAYFNRDGSFLVENSTVSGNTCDGMGGAVYFYDTINNLGGVVRNSTFSGNKAGTNGGAIGFLTSGTDNAFGILTVLNSTFTLNTAGTGKGGAIAMASALSKQNTVVESSIISGNSNAAAPDIFNPNTNTIGFSAIGSNLGFTLTPGAGPNIGFGAALNLLPLANNGGTMLTHLPASGSPVRNAGSNPLGLTLDQRGGPRTLEGKTDIGSVESTDPTPTASVSAPNVVVPGGTVYQFTVTYADSNSTINVSTIGTGDVTISGPNGFIATPTFVKLDTPGNGTPRTATYEFTPPGGSWDLPSELGVYTITMVAGEVFDNDTPTPIAVPAGPVGSFVVQFPANFVVINVADNGPGSLRQAIINSNNNPGIDSVTFDPAVFSTAQTISLTSGQLLVTDSVTITGTGAKLLTVTRDAGALTQFRIFSIDGSGVINVSVSDMKVTGGNTAGNAPGVGGAGTNGDGAAFLVLDDNLILDRMDISGNTSGSEGGAIAVASVNSGGGGGITLRNSTVSGNTANGDPSPGFGGAGGGVYFANGGTLLVENSTVSGNVSTNSFGGGFYLYGNAGVANYTIRNSTVSGNTCATTGGGVLFYTLGANPVHSLVIQNSTIAENTANGLGGGVARQGTVGTLDIVSTIIAKNSNAFAPDFAGDATINFSLIGDGTGNGTITGANNLIGVDPLLNGLADNGGLTKTYSLQAASPAIDQGKNASAATSDQRGAPFVRTNDNLGKANASDGTDIGAFETQPAPAPPTVSVVSVNNGAVQRSRVTTVQVTFSQIVALPGAPETAFQLKRQSDNAIPTLSASVDNTGPGTVVTLSFTGTTAVDSGSLADGRYTLTIDASKVAGGTLDGDNNGSAGGNFVLVGNPATAPKLYRLFGDNDADNDVDTSDFAQFRIAFGGGTSVFDFDNDGDTDTSDFGNFRSRFGASV